MRDGCTTMIRPRRSPAPGIRARRGARARGGSAMSRRCRTPFRARPVDAIIAPHAGLMFSGPVARARLPGGRGARPVRRGDPRRPVAFRRVRRRRALSRPARSTRRSVPPSIDEALGARAARRVAASIQRAAGRARREHSLEMQLPFLARLLPDVPIVPLLMGYQTRDTIDALADALARVRDGRTRRCSSPAPICRTTSTRATARRSTSACRTAWPRSIPIGCSGSSSSIPKASAGATSRAAAARRSR